MKIIKQNIDDHLSRSSMIFLTKRIRDFFSLDENSKYLFFPEDQVLNFDWAKVTETAIVDVVLYGSFLRSFLESGNWTASRYRLWVLSSASKKVLVDLGGIPSEYISVIPRSVIENEKSDERTKTLTCKQWIYAGRLSRSKNLLGVLLVNLFLQKKICDVSLRLFGKFDDVFHENIGRFNYQRTQREEFDLALKCFKWTKKPILKEGLGPDDWISEISQDEVLVNFSTYYKEDFNVSISQVAENGNQVLTSLWGCGADLPLKSSFKFCPSKLPRSNDILGVQLVNAINLSSEIADSQFTEDNLSSTNFYYPKVISSKDIDSFRKSHVKKIGSTINSILRDEVQSFSDSRVGNTYFSKYNKLFSNNIEKVKKIIIYDNFNSISESEQVYAKFKEEGIYLESIKVEHIFFQENFLKVIEAEAVFFTEEAALKVDVKVMPFKFYTLDDRERLPLNVGDLLEKET